MRSSPAIMYEVQGLHGRHEAVGDAALLQHLQRLGLVEVVGPRAAAAAAQVVLTDADPCAAVLAFSVFRVRVSQNTPSREGRGRGFDDFHLVLGNLHDTAMVIYVV